MGGSASTHRVTVEGADTSGALKISDSVAKRLRDRLDEDKKPVEPERPPVTDAPSIQVSDERSSPPDFQRYYDDQLAELDKVSEKVYSKVRDQYIQKVDQVEAKYLKQLVPTPCQDLENMVLQCYNSNSKQTLLCMAQVRAYINCVDKARLAHVTTP